MSGHRLPRLAKRTLRVALPSDWRDDIIAELEPAYAARRARSKWRAWVWLAGQVVAFSARFGMERVRGGRRSPARAADWAHDSRLAVRSLVRSPGFTLATGATLALGMGATTLIFSVVHGVLLKPLPFDTPGELVGVWHRAPGADAEEINMDPGLYFTYREENRVFEDIASWDPDRVTVTGIAAPEEVPAMHVTASLLPVLRVQPLIGPGFREGDNAPDAPETVMLAYGYWLRQFGGDRDVVTRTLRVDGVDHRIVGVLPAGFSLPGEEAAIYLPFKWDPIRSPVGNFNGGRSVARLRPGVTLEQASADIERMIPMALERFGGVSMAMLNEIGFGPNLRPLKDDFVGDVGQVLWVMFGAATLLLLGACANAANLSLVRTEGRHRGRGTVGHRCPAGSDCKASDPRGRDALHRGGRDRTPEGEIRRRPQTGAGCEARWWSHRWRWPWSCLLHLGSCYGAFRR